MYKVLKSVDEPSASRQVFNYIFIFKSEKKKCLNFLFGTLLFFGNCKQKTRDKVNDIIEQKPV